MHPQLNDTKRDKCGDLIEALEECHRQGYISKIFGSCNNFKDELTKCLKSERLDRSRENSLKAIEKRKKIEQRWKQMEEEEYGKDAYLKKNLKSS